MKALIDAIDAIRKPRAEKPRWQDFVAVHNQGMAGSGMHTWGQMSTARSPADPLFWLHHANIDRLWAKWQQSHTGQRPSNGREILKPKPIFGTKVSEVLSTSRLGYRYS